MKRETNRAACAARILTRLDQALGAPVLASTLRVLKSEDWNSAALLAKHWSGVPSDETKAVVIAMAEARECDEDPFARSDATAHALRYGTGRRAS